jgi:hypothetical protein
MQLGQIKIPMVFALAAPTSELLKPTTTRLAIVLALAENIAVLQVSIRKEFAKTARK